jgi:hypothetical protein
MTPYERLALRIEETRALLPLVGETAAQALEARIAAYETALADIYAWLAEPDDPEPEEEAEDAGADARAEAPRIGRPAGGAVVWTEERDAMLVADYVALGAAALLPKLNDLPGATIYSIKAVTRRVADLRTRGITIAERPRGITIAERPRGPVPRAPAALPPALPADIPAEEIAEARDMMRASDKCGAKHLAEYFGWEIGQAQHVAAAIREDLKAAA